MGRPLFSVQFSPFLGLCHPSIFSLANAAFPRADLWDTPLGPGFLQSHAPPPPAVRIAHGSARDAHRGRPHGPRPVGCALRPPPLPRATVLGCVGFPHFSGPGVAGWSTIRDPKRHYFFQLGTLNKKWSGGGGSCQPGPPPATITRGIPLLPLQSAPKLPTNTSVSILTPESEKHVEYVQDMGAVNSIENTNGSGFVVDKPVTLRRCKGYPFIIFEVYGL